MPPGPQGCPRPPKQREGTGQGGVSILPAPQPPPHPQFATGTPAPSPPSHLLPFLAGVTRLALGKRSDQATTSPGHPKRAPHGHGGALTALPGGPSLPRCPGAPGTASTVAAPSSACGAGGHCPQGSPWEGGQPGQSLAGDTQGQRGDPSQRSPSLLSVPARLGHLYPPGAPARAEMSPAPLGLPAPTVSPPTSALPPTHRSARGTLLAAGSLKESRVRIWPRGLPSAPGGAHTSHGGSPTSHGGHPPSRP